MIQPHDGAAKAGRGQVQRGNTLARSRHWAVRRSFHDGRWAL